MTQSKFQKHIGEVIQKNLGCSIKTEVNVKKIFPEYFSNREHYDIVVKLYKLIIECHGEQHKSIVSFGKEADDTEGLVRLINQKKRDSSKEEIAYNNGWRYIIIWQDEISKNEEETRNIVMQKVLNAINDCEEKCH